MVLRLQTPQLPPLPRAGLSHSANGCPTGSLVVSWGDWPATPAGPQHSLSSACLALGQPSPANLASLLTPSSRPAADLGRAGTAFSTRQL